MSDSERESSPEQHSDSEEHESPEAAPAETKAAKPRAAATRPTGPSTLDMVVTAIKVIDNKKVSTCARFSGQSLINMQSSQEVRL